MLCVISGSLHCLQEPRMNVGVACNEAAVRYLSGRSREVSHDSTGLANQQHACCNVPRSKHELPESVEPSASNVGEIERS